MREALNPENFGFIFLNIYGILCGSCFLCGIMAAIRKQWDRLHLFVIAFPFLGMSFLDNYYAWACVELFTQFMTLSQ